MQPESLSSSITTEFPAQREVEVDTHVARPQSDERLVSNSVSTLDAGADNPKNAAGRLIESLSSQPTVQEYASILRASQVIGGEAERLVWGFVRHEPYTQSSFADAALRALAECGDHGAERAVHEMNIAKEREIRDSVRNHPVVRGCCGEH